MKIKTIDSDFFSRVDEEATQYFLGLLATDGYVDKNRNTFSLKLQKRDKHIIDSLRRYLKTNIQVRSRENGEAFELRITDKQLADALRKVGIVNKKSLILKIDCEELEFGPSFWRGAFDGDGNIYVRYETRLVLRITSSSYDFLVQCQAFLKKHIPDGHVTITQRKLPNPNANPCYDIGLYGRTAKAAAKLLYENASEGLYLRRKREVAMNYLNR